MYCIGKETCLYNEGVLRKQQKETMLRLKKKSILVVCTAVGARSLYKGWLRSWMAVQTWIFDSVVVAFLTRLKRFLKKNKNTKRKK